MSIYRCISKGYGMTGEELYEWDEEARWISIRSAWRLSWAAMMASL
jgi:hypothetical protein